MINSSRDKSRVLMIAYGFPPVGGSTAVRVLKLCKYLPEFLWQPVVLTVKKPRVFEFDSGLLQELPQDIEIYRTPSLELPCSCYKGWVGGSVKISAFSYFPLKKLLGRWFKKLRYMLLMVDVRIGWVPFTVFAGYRIIKKRNIKLIYVAVKPFSSLLAAIILKKVTRLPLVIDFHDAWIAFNQSFWNDKPVYFRRLEGIIEKMAVRCADKIISVNENIVNDFRLRYSFCPKDKFISIPNGYDSEDFTEAISARDKDIFSITYTGSLYAKRSPENFLRALKMLLKEDPSLRQRVRFYYIGKVTVANKQFFDDECLKDVIELVGTLPHKECVKRIRQSDLLLFIEDQVDISDMLFPTKIFEYVASSRPILALAKKGLASDLIRESASGVILEDGDIPAIKDKIAGFIKDAAGSIIGQGSDKAVISRYSHEAGSKVLADVFNGLTG